MCAVWAAYGTSNAMNGERGWSSAGTVRTPAQCDALTASRAAGVGKWGGRPAARLVALTLATYGDRCHLCGRRGADSADHVIPRTRGGPDTLENLRPVHHGRRPHCNRRRGNKTMQEWVDQHGRPAVDPPAPSRPW